MLRCQLIVYFSYIIITFFGGVISTIKKQKGKKDYRKLHYAKMKSWLSPLPQFWQSSRGNTMRSYQINSHGLKKRELRWILVYDFNLPSITKSPTRGINCNEGDNAFHSPKTNVEKSLRIPSLPNMDTELNAA